jgi:TetR/AcrR family transcriptional regulator, transcriptional repressor of bet genes
MTSERQDPAPAESAPERGSRMRQRQRLIDACIAALHIHGPSRTTVEKVVSLAGLSPGIVRFYFESKDAMLVASLAHLAAEFEERVLVPVGQLKDTPVRALELLVMLYFDPEIASPRKVSVWYSFWGEASSRQEYYDICGKKDEDFAALVRDLIGRLIAATGEAHLDADAIALGLIGVLEVLWQSIAFQEEAELDREAFRKLSMAYLRSVFPGTFTASADGAATAQAAAPPAARHAATNALPPAVAAEAPSIALPPSAYADPLLLARERGALLRPAWQLIGHRAEMRATGDFLARDLGGERAFVLRDATGALHAYRNACPHRPHALITEARGRLSGPVRCAVHALAFDWQGHLVEGNQSRSLTPLEVRERGGLLWVRGPTSPQDPHREPPLIELPESWLPLELRELAVAADWKVLIEQWLESLGEAQALGAAGRARSTERHVLAPNHLLERQAHSVQLLQLLPVAPARCVVRSFRYAPRSAARDKWPQEWLKEQVSLAESTQLGLALGTTEGSGSEPACAPLERFHRSIAALLSATGVPRRR